MRVFGEYCVRRIFGHKKDEVTEESRRRHNKELYSLYSSAHITRVIKSKRLRWAGHVACMGENLREVNHLKDQGIDGRIILK